MPLVEEGLVDAVVRQLMSGKEAVVFVVRCGQDIRCAKVYKEPEKRAFRQAVDYTQGRNVKNSRRARAMAKGTRYGRKEIEEAWQNSEVDALRRLAAAGVRVPVPYNFLDGVLLMELVTDAEGNAAPRLNDLELTPETAREYHKFMIAQVVLMLCAGIVHGDLSEYNVLVDAHGPVIIDLPQAVDAAGNIGAGAMLERDVDNMATYFGKFAPELRTTDYGKEIWALYEAGTLVPGFYAFQQNGIDPMSDFKAMIRSNHETNLLAVATRQVDVATNNNESLERLRMTQPERAAMLREIWRSPLIAADPLVWRTDLPADVKQKIRDFLVNYGKNSAEEKKILDFIGFGGFQPSSNAQLLPYRQLRVITEKNRVMADTVLSDADKKTKLAELDKRLAELSTQVAAAK